MYEQHDAWVEQKTPLIGWFPIFLKACGGLSEIENKLKSNRRGASVGQMRVLICGLTDDNAREWVELIFSISFDKQNVFFSFEIVEIRI